MWFQPHSVAHNGSRAPDQGGGGPNVRKRCTFMVGPPCLGMGTILHFVSHCREAEEDRCETQRLDASSMEKTTSVTAALRASHRSVTHTALPPRTFMLVEKFVQLLQKTRLRRANDASFYHSSVWGHEFKSLASASRRLRSRSDDAHHFPFWGNVCPARARRATFLLAIPTSAPDLPSHGEAPQVDHVALHTFPTKHVAK